MEVEKDKEIDFIKLEKDIKSLLLKKKMMFHDNRVIPEISVLLDELGIISLNTDTDYSFIVGTVLLLASTILLNRDIKKNICEINNDSAIIIQETLRNTDTYKICLDTYFKYIDKYVFLLSNLGIKDSNEIAILYQYMLDNGLLSYNKQYSYDKEKMTKKLHQYIGLFELDELTGCKVATGVGVCRHSSSQLTDILKRVGYNSYNFYVEGLTDNTFNTDTYKLNRINHQYTIIENGDQKYFGYCTTSKSFIELDFDFDDKYIHVSTIPLIEGEKLHESIIPLDFNLLVYDNKKIVLDLLNRKKEAFREMNLSLLIHQYIEMENLIRNNNMLLDEFYENTKEDLEIISNNYKKVVPSSGKIKQLKIR